MAKPFFESRRPVLGPGIADRGPADELPALGPALAADAASDRDEARFDRRRWWSFGLGTALVVALIVIGVAQRGFAGSPRDPRVGTVAPDFTLTALDGAVIRLSGLRGHPVVLNFWASWCAPCRDEAPALAAVARAQADRVTFLGVDVRDQVDDAQRFSATYGLPYASVSDPAGTVEHLYTGIGIPFTVFINADGTIARTWLGPLDERRLLAFIEELT